LIARLTHFTHFYSMWNFQSNLNSQHDMTNKKYRAKITMIKQSKPVPPSS